ncbi:cysteine hydrolase family protein [Vibrio parahaemolyticus]|uniref:cysteine hydrolase family protein n=1 Tax=Vibrio parahaemolyticus TaxID=670 RepID=UPI00111FB526|nr:cysteine hydrolase family protein [Vibrio parahaemolyticus]TOF59103.1 cysteine hydrolase [Vibrio parahaemolyticus]
MSNSALLVIDIQNDYFPNGRFPLWNTDATLDNIKQLMAKAKAQDIPIFLVQHVSSAPIFEEGSVGVEIHPDVISICPDAEIIQKQHADSFYQTDLEQALERNGVDELLICGMMTQNCVTHTAISKAAEKYNVSIIEDCCTTTDQMIHNIALSAVSIRIPLLASSDVLLK